MQLATPEPKAPADLGLDVMLLVYASCTTPGRSAGEGKHSAISSFVYLKVITRKNIWRNVIVSFQKSPGKESWTGEACFHTRHKADFRPVPITFWKKARSCQIFISSYIPVVWVEETKNFGGEVISGTLGRTKAPRASPQRELPSGRSAVSVPHHILKHCGKKTKTTKEVTEIKAIHQNVKKLSHDSKVRG